MSHSHRSSPHFVSRSPCGVVAMHKFRHIRSQVHHNLDALHDKIGKEVVIPRTQSLEVATGDQNGNLVEFTRNINFTLRQFNNLPFDSITTPPIPLYLSHVLWSMGFDCRKVGGDAFKLSLVHIGPHLSHYRLERPDPDLNSPKGLEAPEILAASFTFLSAPNKETKERYELTPALDVTRTFSSSDLMRYAFRDPNTGNDVHIRIRIVIARCYFSLANLIDLNPMPKAEIDDVVASIVRGEKPADSDWLLTVAEANRACKGQGDATSLPSCFHVHKKTLARRSYAFKKLFASNRSENNFLVIEKGRAGCKLIALTSDDMKVVIPLLYGTAVPLPKDLGTVSALIKKLQRLFKPDLLTTDLYPHWERAICKRALAVDKTSDAKLLIVAYLMVLVWTCPYGSMPVAKRVTIGVMADMMHLKGRRHTLDYMEAWGREVSTMMCMGGDNEELWKALYSHQGKVVVVHKRLFAETDDNQPKSGNKWGCVIC